MNDPTGRRFESPLEGFLFKDFRAFIAALGGANGDPKLGDVVRLIAGGSMCFRRWAFGGVGTRDPLRRSSNRKATWNSNIAELYPFSSPPPWPSSGDGAGNDVRHFPIKQRAAALSSKKRMRRQRRPGRETDGTARHRHLATPAGRAAPGGLYAPLGLAFSTASSPGV
jgi:hypothetical protein